MQKRLGVPVLLVCLSTVMQVFADSSFTNSLGMKMVRINPGTFEMGNPNAKHDSWDEQPAHRVTISQPFFLSETEVTTGQFKQFRQGSLGSRLAEPYTTGLSWHDAVAFCAWLSEKEGTPYRLPTEAEWEYAARAGTNTDFWSGQRPPEPGTPNRWGLKNIHCGPAEWCLDWYGPYRAQAQVDPAGPETGFSRVVRGGGIEMRIPHYARSHNRASHAPAFAMMKGTELVAKTEPRHFSDEPALEGLIGLWYGRVNFENPKAVDPLLTLDIDWDNFQQPGQDRATLWSAQWEGWLVAPTTGEIAFHIESDWEASLTIDGAQIVALAEGKLTGDRRLAMDKGKRYPVRIRYVHNGGEKTFLSIGWSWNGQERTSIPRGNLWHSEIQREEQRTKGPRLLPPGHHTIGFRVVQGPIGAQNHHRSAGPFIQQCVVQEQPYVAQGPALAKPWFRKRDLMPVPPDDSPQSESVAVGLFPGCMPHVTNPGLVVCPNGDVLALLFTAAAGPGGEDRPDVSLIATRLRFGANRWDMPESMIDFADVNDTSSLLWQEGETIYCFWGHTFCDHAYPFQWTSSVDNGATWSGVRFPQFVTPIGPHTHQPINSAIRPRTAPSTCPATALGELRCFGRPRTTWPRGPIPVAGPLAATPRVPCSATGGFSGWGANTPISMATCPNPVLAMAAKRGRRAKRHFARWGPSNAQRCFGCKAGACFSPVIFSTGLAAIPRVSKGGAPYAALSADEGVTWHIKKLLGTLPYDGLFPYINQGNPHHTLGYSVARQAPNGIIHLVSTFNHPAQHWELNEAWILDEKAGYQEHKQPQKTGALEFEPRYAAGKVRANWSGAVTEEGECRLHGKQKWYYANGKPQWEVKYEMGSKIGAETYWDDEGNKIWMWQHHPDATSVWTQYYHDGKRKSESTWRYHRAEAAMRWDRTGALLSQSRFVDGRLLTTYPGAQGDSGEHADADPN